MGRLRWVTPGHRSLLSDCGQVALLSKGQLCHWDTGAAMATNTCLA